MYSIDTVQDHSSLLFDRNETVLELEFSSSPSEITSSSSRTSDNGLKLFLSGELVNFDAGLVRVALIGGILPSGEGGRGPGLSRLLEIGFDGIEGHSESSVSDLGLFL